MTHPPNYLGGWIDGRPAMEIVGELYRRGERPQRMAEVSGLTVQTIMRLALGEAPRVWRSTAIAAEKLWQMLPEEDRRHHGRI
ncbi:MAG: hypothetical protein ACRDH7_07530 [Actinomycetota bacterium]